jgi:hypothetical protein
MQTPYIDASDVVIVNSRLIGKTSIIVLLTPVFVWKAIPAVGGFGLRGRGLTTRLSGQNTWQKFFTPAPPVKTV